MISHVVVADEETELAVLSEILAGESSRPRRR
jgi:hypothetical protein